MTVDGQQRPFASISKEAGHWVALQELVATVLQDNSKELELCALASSLLQFKFSGLNSLNCETLVALSASALGHASRLSSKGEWQLLWRPRHNGSRTSSPSTKNLVLMVQGVCEKQSGADCLHSRDSRMLFWSMGSSNGTGVSDCQRST